MSDGRRDVARFPMPEERAEILERKRTWKMARSAHAYVRGSTAQFYRWLGEVDRGLVPEAPPVWICGDCHLGNLGPLADAGGRVRIGIRDLDQSVPGNPAHDVIRLGLSLSTAARGSDLPGVTTAHMLEEMASWSRAPTAAGSTSPRSGWSASSPPSRSASASGPCPTRSATPSRRWCPRRPRRPSAATSTAGAATTPSRCWTPPTG